MARDIADPPPAEPTKAEPRTEPNTGQLRQLLRRQETVRSVVETFSGELELQPLLESILRNACELIGAEHGTIGLVDPARDLVRTAAGYHMPPGEAGPRCRAGSASRAWCSSAASRWCSTAMATCRIPPSRGSRIIRVIGMPIVWSGRMIGFLGVGTGTARLGPEQAETLALFARPAAIAIANAQRYEDERQRGDRMALVARVGRLVTGNLRLDELLQRAADDIHELLGCPHLAIPLIDPEEPGTLVLTVKGGPYKNRIPGEYRIPITQGLMGEAARTRRTVLVNDVTADPRYLPTPGGTPSRAELAVPITLGERVLGVVNVERDEPFCEEDAAIVGDHRRPARGGDRERAALRQRPAGGRAGGAAAPRARAARRGDPAPLEHHAHRADARAGVRAERRGGRGPRAARWSS